MPCGQRLDAPGTLHWVTVRGIEWTVIFRDDPDRADCLARLATQVEAGVPQMWRPQLQGGGRIGPSPHKATFVFS